jgi:LL-diaminopimelate aminotransferase
MKADRLLSLPPYLFEELENRYDEAVGRGRDVIDLSIGDPDLTPPASLCDRLDAAVRSNEHHQYPPQRGLPVLKDSVRRYLSRRCGCEPANDQILILVGSKEGIAHLPWAVCNPGDGVLLPDPGYPVYNSAVTFVGGEKLLLPLDRERGFLPDFGAVERKSLERARLCFLNYPNNPTSATAGPEVFAEALKFSDEYGFVLVNDAAYADVYEEGDPPPLLCGQPGMLDRPAIEFFSFSKTYSVTGWRLGFAVGRPDVIEALAHMKANIDSGQFGAIQQAVAETLNSDGDAYVAEMRGRYARRRRRAVELLESSGFHCFPSYATFYLWAQVPTGWKSMDYALHVLDKADVLVTPGIGFGPGGEGYFRIALTRPVERIEEAIHRLTGL